MNHRKNQRLKNFDYSQEDIYFVTTLTHKRIHYFGKIQEGKMHCSIPGIIARNQWLWLTHQYPYLELHDYVIMPNHVHALIQICHPTIPPQPVFYSSSVNPPPFPKIKSLSEIVGAYKTTVSKQIHLAGYKNFKWHRSFHDHIVRNEKAFDYISSYIVSNPERWEGDVFHRK